MSSRFVGRNGNCHHFDINYNILSAFDYSFLVLTVSLGFFDSQDLTAIILSPISSCPSASAAPPGIILVTKMPQSPGTWLLPMPPAMEKPSPLSPLTKSISISFSAAAIWMRRIICIITSSTSELINKKLN